METFVIPAKAGIHEHRGMKLGTTVSRIPAFAGMTEWRIEGENWGVDR
jgi:hypothetical protein